MNSATFQAFSDELEKIAISAGLAGRAAGARTVRSNSLGSFVKHVKEGFDPLLQSPDSLNTHRKWIAHKMSKLPSADARKSFGKEYASGSSKGGVSELGKKLLGRGR